MTMLAIGAVAAACDAVPVTPTATPFRPTAPLMRYQSSSAWELDGANWTFKGSVNPNGSPTDVVLEIGSGTEGDPAFDRSLPVKEGLILPEAFEFETDDPVPPFCVRFTATNEVGTTSTPALCPTRAFDPPPDSTVAPSASGYGP
jgi:hypothetical protein